MCVNFCKECGEKLLGRSDKKFCSDYCRVSSYNKRNRTSKIVQKINSILKRNRKILRKYIEDNTLSVNKHILLLDGFIFEYFTHEITSIKGHTTRFCYDIPYYVESDEVVRIGQSREEAIQNLFSAEETI